MGGGQGAYRLTPLLEFTTLFGPTDEGHFNREGTGAVMLNALNRRLLFLHCADFQSYDLGIYVNTGNLNTSHTDREIKPLWASASGIQIQPHFVFVSTGHANAQL